MKSQKPNNHSKKKNMSLSFADRHNGPRPGELAEMLKFLGLGSLDELVRKTVPSDILLKEPLALSPAMSETEYLARLKEMASKNKNFRSMIGMGFYGSAVLPVITRNIFENPVWYTSYTPYQAEISQGRLEALLNFQTVIMDLTGFNLTNCSLLDDATAAAEAMRMMYEVRTRDAVKAGKNVVFVDNNIFPHVLSVLKTRAAALGYVIEQGDFKDYSFNEKCYGAIVQYPAADGEVRDYSEFCARAHEKGILVTASCDILSLAVLKEPAAWGADVAVGSSQRLGLPMGFGGPVAGYMATDEKYKRNIPGRIIGVSVDRLGKKSLRLALQTREQHIKRDKATSNVCTASALCATMSGMYAVYHGPEGLRSIAAKAAKYAHVVGESLKKAGYRLANDNFFDTIEVCGVNAGEIKAKAEAMRINFYYPDGNRVRFSFDELSDCEEAKKVLSIFGVEAPCGCSCADAGFGAMNRESAYLQDEVFNKYHSETEMMRYIKKLERRDISLTHSMIPLGSCTMKLNAAAEMMPLSWSELTNIHPYAPQDQAEGYLEMIRELEHDLAVITGFDSCSLQPTSGAAGEYAGLMTIRAYHHSRNEDFRNLMIIPTSAHGTNPASAVMAGFKIVLVNCDENGNINVEELRQKAEENRANLAGMMITYPSTYGIFEVRIREIIDIIHSNGGLVFMDGANMNAQIGLTSPGYIGADVCHLNLHKSFAMPHGGGGPGAGPICMAKHLTPFRPGHDMMPQYGGHGTPVSAAPFGNAMLMPITHAYIKMLGEEGLKRATMTAILNANYISERLKDSYKTLFKGAMGHVGHECILDLQNFKAEYGVDSTDIAKRLMDYGFHAPTLSFPVHETLMVEPTESEGKAELDRFIDTMVQIKSECEDIKSGKLDTEDNPIKNAPHTADEVCADKWEHKYGREIAAFPLEWIRDNKLWPFVSRVDNGYGDRNLVCSCHEF